MKIAVRILQALFAVGMAAVLVFVGRGLFNLDSGCKDVVFIEIAILLFGYFLLYTYLVYKSYKSASAAYPLITILMGLAYSSFVVYVMYFTGD